jgi:hypothetical protein
MATLFLEPHAWSDIVAHYHRGLATAPGDDGFKLAVASIGALAEQIELTGLGRRLFGWTSMHDLCIQQLNRPPYTCAYLRIAPLCSGQVDFRYLDTPVEPLQWHRIVFAQDTTQRFVGFLNQLKWVDRESADCLGAPISQNG